MNRSRSLCSLASPRANEPVMYAHALLEQIFPARVSWRVRSSMRDLVYSHRRSSVAPTFSLPLKDLGEYFRLLDRIVHGVVRVDTLRPQTWI